MGAEPEGVFAFPLSFAQERLWFLHEWDPESPAYNVPAAQRIRGPLDAAALERALHEVVQRHEVLRATFATGEDARPVQRVAPPAPTRLEVLDLSALDAPTREAEALRLATQDAVRPFRLRDEPGLRARLLRLAPEDHVLVLTLHHIVSDAWSMGVLLRELTTLYAAHARGAAPSLPELPIQYADYAIWQREWLQGDALEERLAYWRGKLAGVAPLDLPMDRPRPRAATMRGSVVRFHAPLALADRLRALARREGATLYMTLLAAFKTLLHRYSGQDDVTVGSPVAGRTRAEVEGLIGFFVNTLVLRTDAGGDPTFLEFLARVRETCLDAYAHQDVPFEKLVAELHPERDLSRAPFFQASFALQNAPQAPATGHGASWSPFPVDTGTSKGDLELFVTEEPEGLRCAFTHSTDLFDAATVARFATHLRVLLDGIAEDPARPLSGLPILPPAERRQLVEAWNDTRVAYPLETPLHRLLEAQAARTPGEVALVFEDQRLTFAELNARANRLARHLRRLGVGPDVLVGIAAERSIEMVVGLVGVLKAGGAYVPLDPEYPRDRLAFMLEDAKAPVLLTQARLLDRLPPAPGARVLCLDRDWPLVADEDASDLPDGAGPDDLAYVIYTSGSTGKPKGVMIPHRGIVNRLLWMQDAYRLTASDRVLQKTPFSFDVSVWEFFWPLMTGARLVAARPGGHKDPAYLADAIEAEGVTTLHFVPSMLHAFLASVPAGRCPSLRHVMCSGEALPHDLQERFFSWTGAELHNLYGPTEASVDVSHHTCRRGSDSRVVPIGRPIANTQLLVLDARLQPVPIGVPGELFLGGVGLARGYLNRPDLTAEKFIPHPFSEAPGARLYRTGDLARVLPDGNVDYLGRLDHQVKVRGFRIELGEIEAALKEHAGVAEAVVLAREDAPGEKRLIAYLVPRGGAALPAAELRAHLQRTLPDHMVPAVFLRLDALPLSPNGKLDRKALPAPDASAPERAHAYEPPATPTEETLARIWSEVLRVERVGAEDNFFELGGDSILSLRVVARAREQGVGVTPRDLFERQTLRALAAGAAGAALPDAAARVAPFGLVSATDLARVPPGVEDAYPLTRLQLGMLFHSDYHPDSALYVNWDGFRVDLPFHEDALRSALTDLMARHPALRTSFHLSGFEEPLQLVHSDVPPPLAVDDLRGLAPDARDAALDAALHAEGRRRYRWDAPGLFHVHVRRLTDESLHFTLGFHHAVADGWSLMVLIEELLRAYRARVHGSAPALPPLAASMRDYVALERDALASEASRRHWAEHLDGSSLAPLPASSADPRGGGRVARDVVLPPAVAAGARALSRALGVPLSSVFLAAHARVMGLLAGQDDVVTGVVTHGRPEATDGDRAVGLFLNSLPLRFRLAPATWSGLVRHAFDVERAALPHRRYPMADVQKERGGPLFHTLFTFTHWHALRRAQAEDGVRLDGWRSFAELDVPLAAFVNVEADERVRLILQADARLVDDALLARVEAYYLRALDAMTRDPEARHESCPLVGEEEARLALGPPPAAFPAESPLHRAFEAQAARTPDAVALSFEGRAVTYAELNARANRLARRLRALGVGPDDLVGLCMERSAEMIVGMLGILKAGGAYLPLDPAYPADRLRFMLEDARPRVVVTQAGAAAALPPHDARVLPLSEADAGDGAEDLDGGATPQSLAYVIYTSGSTGKPKGVMVEHRHVARLFTATDAWFGFGERDVWTMFHSFAFDFSVWEVWGALLHGGRLVIVPRDASRDPEAFHDLLAREGVTVLNQTPSAFRQLVRVDGERPDASSRLRLRLVVFGGEALEPASLRPWVERHGDERPRLVNMYGITETTVHVTYRPLTRADVEAGHGSPIGRAIPDLEVRVVGPYGHPAPAGVAGEMLVGGAGVARGYLNRPDLTRARFVPDPLRPGARLYRSGDLARVLPDGELEYLGRMDDQVKIRGFRIELGEIEATLLQHPAVREAAVLAREEAPGGRRLVAYVVPRDAPPAVASLRERLAATLPDHMVPAAFVLLDAFPLTSHGKLDRRALPAPGAADLAGAARSYEAPRTPVEAALAEVWAHVLRVPRVGAEDNFFELGGDSILSLQVVARARERGVHVTPRDIFQHPTVAALAAVAGAASTPTAEQGLVTGAVPLTPIQRWLFARGLPRPSHFNQSLLLDAPAGVPASVVEEALGHLLAHHDALRLRFHREGDAWRQEVAGMTGGVRVAEVDLAALDPAAQDAALDAEAARVQASLDLARGPLVGAALFRLGPARGARLLLTIHHLAVDAVSWRVLLEDLETAVAALREGRAVRLPPKTTSFREWATRLEAHARSGAFDHELDAWAPLLHGEAPLPRDHEAGPNDHASARAVSVTLTADETRALLQDAHRAYRTRINDVLLAALLRAAARWTGRAALLVDVEGHGREDVLEGVDLSRTVGWFTTLAPVRLHAPDPADAGATLKAVKETLRAIPRNGIGHGVLRHLAGPDAARVLDSLPRPEVSFNYLGQLDAAGPALARGFRIVPGAKGPDTDPAGLRAHVLDVTAVVREGRLHVAFAHSENLHRRETIEALAAAYAEALRGLLAHCASPGAGGRTPSDFPLARLDARRLHALLRAHPDAEDAYPLTPMQRGMLFHAAYDPGSTAYREQMGIDLEGHLDADAFEAAWRALVQRHAILRTAFAWEGLDEPLQVVRAEATVPFERLDWRGLDPAEQAARLAQRRADDRARGFDLAGAPLMRLALVRLDEARHHLLWSFHHLLLDGWSTLAVLREAFVLYEASREARDPALPRPRPYAEYVAWLQRRDPRAAEAAWRDALDGLDAPTPLPFRAGPSAPHAPPGERLLELPEDATRALQAFARGQRVTLNTVVQAAWALLLGKHGGGGDVVFGATVSGRPADLPGVEDMVGLFINTVPVRVPLPREARVGEWLRDLQERQARLRPFEHAPLVDVQRWSGLGARAFESLVVFENYPVDFSAARPARGLTIRSIQAVEETNYPLTLAVMPGRRLAVRVLHDVHAFPEDALRRLCDALVALLASLPSAGDRTLEEVMAITDGERRELLHAWNDTPRPLPAATPVHRLVEARSAAAPHRLAVAQGGERMTYGELDARSTRLARRLRRLGAGRDARVGVWVERSPDLLVALLGVLKAGAAYVPLDPAHPEARLGAMLDDAGAALLVARGPPPALLSAGRDVVRLDEAAAWPDEPPEDEAEGDPRDLAYVIYTSGSTGTPKGVMVEHASLANLVHWHNTTYRVTPDDRATLLAGLGFDASVWEAWPYLAAGASLHLPPDEETRADPERLVAWLAENDITISFLPTPLAERVLALDALPPMKLRALLTGGDRLRAGASRALPFRVVNHYGPTEGTVVATACDVPPATLDPRPPPIGRPILNARAYVLDRDLRLVPVGAAGELFLGGDGLARGYLGHEDLTAERFVPDPFRGEGRMYRTGDLVRWRADGHLEFLGRLDDQVKVRGVRIELGEVEAALARDARVAEAVVVARDVAGDAQLVAYVVARAPIEAGDLRASLQLALPAAMVPSAFVLLDALPLTPNGKVDRKALPPPPDAPADPGGDAPRTPTEEILAGVFADVLGVERVGARADFFALGGHSLLAMQVASRVRASLGVELPLRDLFTAPTVEALARLVATRLREDAAAPPPLLPALPGEPAPLSFAQERLWFLHEWDPASPAYNVPLALRLQGALDADALALALAALTRRHHALRTSFPLRDGRPVQVVAAPDDAPLLAVEDLSGMRHEAREAEARRLADEEARRPFDLKRGPVFRARLLRLDAEDHVLLLTLHHVAFDGWSHRILLTELAALYGSITQGNGDAPLPDLPVQPADHARWQRAWLQGDALEGQLAYWRGRLADAPVLDLPTDRPRPAVRSSRGAQHAFSLPPRVLEGLRALARREGVTLHMALLAAYQAQLHRYTGLPSVVVGSPVAGRSHREVEGLVGFFVNTLALRTDVSGDATFRELLARVRETCLDAYAHQDVPFEKLVDELHPQRDPSRSPIVQTVLVLERAGDGPSFAGLDARPLATRTGTSKFDLTLLLSESETDLRGAFEYSTDLFDEATVARFARHYATLLAGLVEDPDRRLSRAPLLPEDERRLLEAWSGEARPYPRDATIHGLFEAQSARRPDAVAVSFDGGALTYRELDARANRLAHRLQRLGVGPDVLVGLCLERSPDMIVATLAVLKAGGAYVPLDPDYPAERLRFLVEDARPRVVLTTTRLAGVLPAASPLLLLDAEADALAREPDAAPVSAAAAEALAYVMFTSGSTGRPKGVAVPHRAVVRLVHAQDYVAFSPDEVFLQLAPTPFDASTFEIWGALLSGARLALAPAGNLTIPEIAGVLRASGATTLWLTAPLFHLLVDEDVTALRGVRQLIAGGDALSLPHVQRAARALPGCRIVNGYGPTEGTTFTCCHPVADADALAGSVPLGRPLANTRVHVLDATGALAPVGVPGELLIGGDGLARGYLNRADLTRERFVPDPFSADPDARLYRTGDLVRWRADGTLDFLGRLDHQVKIRGFRVEPGEVEAALGAHPDVREVVVVVREDAPGDKRLVAYLVPRAATPTVAALREFLKRTLPDHMVPARFVPLDALPLTPNGKVDRRALPAPDDVRADAADAVAPRSDVEATLAEIWSRVLRVPRVGVHDNFFELGGDSILSIQVIARAAERGLRLTPRLVFQHQTIARLAEVVGTAPAAVAEQGPVTGPVPLTPVQRWYFEEGLPRSFNQSRVFDVPAGTDASTIEAAIQRLVDHHDALRLQYRRVGAAWTQEIAPPGPAAFARIDLSHLPEPERDAALEAEAARIQAALDPEEGPLARAALFDLGPARPKRLLLALHHLVVDGVSWRVLAEDLEAACRGAPLPPKTTSFRAWAERLVEHADSDVLAAEREHWLAASGADALPLPRDVPDGANTVASTRVITVVLPEDETRALLRDVPQAYRTQINDALLAAFAQAFARWTGPGPLLVHLEGHGREEIAEGIDVSRTVGWFTSMFPVRLDGADPDDPGAALRAVKETLRAVPRHGIGHGILRHLADDATRRRLAAAPRPEVTFNYLGQMDLGAASDGFFLRVTESKDRIADPAGARSHLLDVTSVVTEGRLHASILYSENVHHRATIEALADAFLDALRGLIRHCASPDAGGYTPSDFPLGKLDQRTLDSVMRKLVKK